MARKRKARPQVAERQWTAAGIVEEVLDVHFDVERAYKNIVPEPTDQRSRGLITMSSGQQFRIIVEEVLR